MSAPDPFLTLDLKRFEKMQSIVQLDAEYLTLLSSFVWSQKKSADAQVPGLSIEKRDLRATNAVGSISGAIQAKQVDPLLHQPGILSRR